MTCKECGQVGKLTALMQYHNDTELSSLEETGSEFNRSKADMFAEGRIRPVCGLGSMCTRSFMWWWSKWVGVIPSRRSVLGKKRLWVGRPSASAKRQKCMRSMKRVDLVLRCNASSLLSGSTAM